MSASTDRDAAVRRAACKPIPGLGGAALSAKGDCSVAARPAYTEGPALDREPLRHRDAPDTATGTAPSPAHPGTEAAMAEQRAAEIAAEYERWSYGEGYTAGRVDGGRDGWRDGYAHGFGVGAEVGAARMLLQLEHVIGRERLAELAKDADARLPHAGEWQSYRARTTYHPVADRREWRGLDNGDQLPTWEHADDDDHRTARSTAMTDEHADQQPENRLTRAPVLDGARARLHQDARDRGWDGVRGSMLRRREADDGAEDGL